MNDEQKRVLEAVQRGRNIFITGAGGTGKSYTIRAIVDWAEHTKLRYAVTATTGCAALLLGMGAKTIHSWAGVGLAREAGLELVAYVRRSKSAVRRWTQVQLLIIDEVSMMNPEFLEKLDIVARTIRHKQTVRFGGIQLVLCGDFCQLPPVVKGISGETCSGVPRFIFELPLWSELIDESHELLQIQRQADPIFQKVLSEARFGELSPESIKILQSRVGLPWQDSEIQPTLIFTRNAEVDTVNRKNMELLEGERQVYSAITVVADSDTGCPATTVESVEAAIAAAGAICQKSELTTALERLDEDAPYVRDLELAVGAQVMLVSNLNQAMGLVNGSRGVVIGYTKGGRLPVVRFAGQKDPITIERANWWLPDHENIGRAQIPLRVAYAITVHKSQGATIDSALVDISSKTFEYGQAYVALSRVRSLDGLYIWKLDPSRVLCHPTVREFYRTIRGATAAAEPPPPSPEPWSLEDIPAAWTELLTQYLDTPSGIALRLKVAERRAVAVVEPAPADVFAALRYTDTPAAVRVLIIGQDPYPTAGNAHGLAFSMHPRVSKLAASLVNIFKELVADIGGSTPSSGCLTGWAEQGVLLLNDILTVNVGSPLSHAAIGWQELTHHLIRSVLEMAPHVAVVAWGKNAQKKLQDPRIAPLLGRHTIITAPHPSPLSAHTGFFGSKPFSKINAALEAHGQPAIRWNS